MDWDTSLDGDGATELEIELVSHYRLKDKPVRTLETLRIFLHQQADEVYSELRAGRPVLIRRGPRAEMAQLARLMQVQGFNLRILPVTSQD